ncbi:MAG: hypothetical protein ACO1G9_09790 [Bacteroidota bacterium]
MEEHVKNKKEVYNYHIEDGQFSYDFTKDYLLGKEGEIVNVFTERCDDYEDIYIVFIDGKNVECLGNIERSFPSNKLEHDALKASYII